mmetsp:Transcript_2178/g.2840  ORF Transcript_2178/g.2840 Transcript_2178/m.2840 type:complete len:223 (-) Transcript_2178:5-673(-)
MALLGLAVAAAPAGAAPPAWTGSALASLQAVVRALPEDWLRRRSCPIARKASLRQLQGFRLTLSCQEVALLLVALCELRLLLIADAFWQPSRPLVIFPGWWCCRHCGCSAVPGCRQCCFHFERKPVARCRERRQRELPEPRESAPRGRVSEDPCRSPRIATPPLHHPLLQRGRAVAEASYRASHREASATVPNLGGARGPNPSRFCHPNICAIWLIRPIEIV